MGYFNTVATTIYSGYVTCSPNACMKSQIIQNSIVPVLSYTYMLTTIK